MERQEQLAQALVLPVAEAETPLVPSPQAVVLLQQASLSWDCLLASGLMATNRRLSSPCLGTTAGDGLN